MLSAERAVKLSVIQSKQTARPLLNPRALELRVNFLDLNIEVAIDFERFDLFGEVESLSCFGWRYYYFFSIDSNAQRHRESFNDSLVIKRNALPVYAVFE